MRTGRRKMSLVRPRGTCQFCAVRIIVIMAVICCLLGGLRPEHADAQEAGAMVSMTVSYGFDEQARYGRCFLVNVTLTNHGGAFEGVLTVSVSTGGEDAIVTERGVRQIAKSSREYVIPVGAYTTLGDITITLADLNGQIVFAEVITPEILNYGNNYLIGVWASEQNYDYLEYLGGKVLYLEKDALPKESWGYDMFDMLILDGVNSEELNVQTREAIENFVYAGGTLVLGTGENGLAAYAGFEDAFGEAEYEGGAEELRDYGLNRAEALAELRTAIVEYEDDRESLIAELEAMGGNTIRQNQTVSDERYEAQVLCGNYVPVSALVGREVEEISMEPIRQISAVLSYNGASEIACRDGHTMLYRKECGDGTVLLWTSALGTEAGTDTRENLIWYAQAKLLKQHINEARKERVELEMYGSALDYRLLDTVGYMDETRIPRVGSYAVVLCIYVLVVGPVLYLLLRKKDQTVHIWWMIPVMAVIFTLIVYAMGSDTRITRPYVDYINLLQYDEAGGVRGTMYFSVTVPSSRKETLTVSQGENLLEIRKGSIPNYYLSGGYVAGEREYPVSTTYHNTALSDGSSTVLTLHMYPAFTRAYYRSDYQAGYQTDYQTDYGRTQEEEGAVLVSAEGVIGSIHNNTQFNLTDVLFVGDRFLSDLGDLASGEITELDKEKTEFLATRDKLWDNAIMGRLEEASEKNPGGNEAKKINLIQYFLERQVYREGQSFLIGFTEEMSADNLLADSIARGDGSGITMVTIPIEVSHTSGGIEYVPLMDSYMNVLEGSYEDLYHYRYLDGDVIRVEYYLPKDDTVTAFLYTEAMNPDYSRKTLTGFEGEIYFWNQVTGRYDLVFESGKSGKIEAVEQYLNSNNVLTVEYRRGNMYLDNYMTLPYLSYEKEADEW